MLTPKQTQTGVALISVLLVFALAMVIAAEVISRHYRDIRRTANVINSKQAYYYSIGGEQFARQILYRDYSNDIDKITDTLTDQWAQPFTAFEIENGHMSIEIIDLQGRFNLNNLSDGSGRAVSEFRQLLKVLDINTDYTGVLQDWLDSDNVEQPNGGEDDSYQTHYNAYLTANREMSDRSELRLLNTMSIEDYNKLKNYVVALPAGTKYNINTLDAKIIQALSAQISNEEAKQLQRLQQQGGYQTIAQWLSVNAAKELAPMQRELDVFSEYFEVIVKTVYDERTSVVRTQLFRDKLNGQLQVIKRQQGFE